ncbi:MAG: carbonic anhydrase [Bdellovibrionales bacterium]|nr:carbonic anhydrase [Bdellovibrionales bacterium]
MKHATKIWIGIGVLALAPACALPQRNTTAMKDPFADPSKFENLASAAYSMPTSAVVAPPPVSDVAQAVGSGPVPVPAMMTGGSLVSPALAYLTDVPHSTANRAPASVVFPKDERGTPDDVYLNLVRGNERFVTGMVKGEHRDEARRRSLAGGQQPLAVVLSCSDSRVPPELIFDQGLGDLVTIRVAGNVLGSAQVASIEYAVHDLGAKLIVVMGHESCDAVKAAIEAKPGKTKFGAGGSPDRDWLVGAIRPVLKSRGLASVSTDDPKLRKPVMANIDSVTENLVVRSKTIGDALTKGNLKVVRGIYSMDTGRVDFWGLK